MNAHAQNSHESDKQTFWRRHLDQWRSSGQSQVDYCYDHCLAYATFHYWKRKLSKSAEAPLRLVPLVPLTEPVETKPSKSQPRAQPEKSRHDAAKPSRAPAHRSSGVRLRFNGIAVEVDIGFDPGTLQALIALLEARDVADR